MKKNFSLLFLVMVSFYSRAQVEIETYPKERLKNDKPAYNKYIPPNSGPNTFFLPVIYFDADKYNISSTELPKLDYVSEIMIKYPKLTIEVLGFTDAQDEGYNLKLSENRSKEAIQYLVSKKGVSPSRFVMKYIGETDNSTPTEVEIKEKRRVEFHIYQ